MSDTWDGAQPTGERWIVEGLIGPRWAFLAKRRYEDEAFEQYALYCELYPDQAFRIVHEETIRTITEGTE